MKRKQYYLAAKFLGGKMIRDVWHCSHETALSLTQSYDFILPLDRKPRKEIEIKEGV